MTMFPRCQQCGSIGWCNCGAQKFKQRTEEDIKQAILSLNRYYPDYYSGYDGYGCGATMEVGEDGEYIKLEDILNIFGAKKL